MDVTDINEENLGPVRYIHDWLDDNYFWFWCNVIMEVNVQCINITICIEPLELCA